MVLCDRNNITHLPLDSPSFPLLFSGIGNVLQQSVIFVANKACMFACLCYRLGSQSVHLYVNFTPVILQHGNIAGQRYEYAMISGIVLFSFPLVTV